MLSTYKSLCDAIVLLLEPLVEIVIHDLESKTIAYIRGNLSFRKVGDDSLLDEAAFEAEMDKIVYPKLNFDGRLIKSISVPISTQWLICINCDISVFNHMQTLSQQFLKLSNQPESLFKNDWQEKLHLTLHSLINDNAWDFNNLNSTQKKAAVKHLFSVGAFKEKKAADYIADTLNMGRATIFKYLKEWKKNDNESI